MEEKNKLSWAVPAYPHDKKTVDWFWGFGIVIFSLVIASIFLSNYYLAFILFIGGILMIFFAHKEPETLYYELDDKGLKIKDNIFIYKNIKAFWIKNDNNNPYLFIKTERFFLPEIKITINANVTEKIKDIFVKHEIPEVEMQEHFYEKIMDFIGY